MNSFFQVILILFSIFSLRSYGMTNLERCTWTAEILKQASVDLMKSEQVSLIEYANTKAGKMVKKHFSGAEQEIAMATTYKIARDFNEDALAKVQLARQILDKAKVKYELAKLVGRSYDNMMKKIDDQAADCVLRENSKEAQKSEPNKNSNETNI